MHTKTRVIAAGITAAISTSAGAQLEEVVVTAQKRVESQQEVPISISAFTGDRLADTQVVDLKALSGAAPNVQIQHFSNTPHGAVFNIRGMGVIEPDPYAGQTVTTVVDGVPLVFNMLSLLDLYDVERIEIHRGPQGTLFGANTTGGVVNVVTRQPTGELGGDMKVTMGSWDRLDLKGTFNFPIIDSVAGKITAQHHSREGWHTNVVDGSSMGDRDVTSFRGYLQFEPTADFDATLIGEWTRSRNGGPIVVNGSFPGEVTGTLPGTLGLTNVPLTGRSPGPGIGAMYQGPCTVPGQPCEAPDEYFSANDSVRDVSDQDVYSVTLTMNWDTGLGELTSITGIKTFDLFEETDQDGSPFFIDDTRRGTEGTQYSQELRLTWNPLDNTEVISGVFYQTNNWTHYQNFRIPFNGAPVPGLGQLNQLTENDWNNWSVSLFSHAFIDLTDKLRAQLGVRGSHETTEADIDVTTFANPNAGGGPLFDGGVPIGPPLTVDDEESWTNWAMKFGLDYQWTEDFMTYGFFSRGFKSGGFTGRISLLPEEAGPFDPEFVKTLEVGIKSEWFDNRVRFNASAFRNWYKDLQLAQIFFCTDGTNTFNCNTILNAASAITQGLEFEIRAVPLGGLTLTANAGYLHAEYEEFPFIDPATATTIALDGERLQNAPDWTLNLGLSYEFPLLTGSATYAANYTYTGEKFFGNLQNTPRSTIQSTHYLDMNVKWRPANEKWAVNLWATNITDNRYIDSVFDAPGFIGLMSYGPPRQWGASFEYFF